MKYDKTKSAYADYPGYRVDLVPQTERVRVYHGDTLVADSTRTLRVKETKHADAIYVPEHDVRRELFEPTDHHSFCPFKGEASYWSLKGETPDPNLVWMYPEPFPEGKGLVGYVSFYPDRVRFETE